MPNDTLRFKVGGEMQGGRPQYINFGTGWHVLKVCLVATKPDGIPKLVTVINDDEVVSLAGGEEFVTAYFAIEGFKLSEADIPNIGYAEARPK